MSLNSFDRTGVIHTSQLCYFIMNSIGSYPNVPLNTVGRFVWEMGVPFRAVADLLDRSERQVHRFFSGQGATEVSVATVSHLLSYAEEYLLPVTVDQTHFIAWARKAICGALTLKDVEVVIAQLEEVKANTEKTDRKLYAMLLWQQVYGRHRAAGFASTENARIHKKIALSCANDMVDEMKKSMSDPMYGWKDPDLFWMIALRNQATSKFLYSLDQHTGLLPETDAREICALYVQANNHLDKAQVQLHDPKQKAAKLPLGRAIQLDMVEASAFVPETKFVADQIKALRVVSAHSAPRPLALAIDSLLPKAKDLLQKHEAWQQFLKDFL